MTLVLALCCSCIVLIIEWESVRLERRLDVIEALLRRLGKDKQ
jgi:hypothetical protein